MSTQLLTGGTEAAKEARIVEPLLAPRLFTPSEALENVEEAVLDGRLGRNDAYRFKVLETLFDFLEGASPDLIEAASLDFNGRAPRNELQLEHALTLAQVASVLQSQCKPRARGGPLASRFQAQARITAQKCSAQPLGSVLVVAQHKRPFDDLFAPLASAVAAGNIVCVLLSPTLPSLNAIIASKLCTQLPQSSVFFVSPTSMPEHQDALSTLQAGDFGARIPGSSHLAKLAQSPATAFLSSSLGQPGTAPTISTAATALIDAASMLVGRSSGAPKLIFAHEEVFEQVQEAAVAAAAHSAANLCPRGDGSSLQELLRQGGPNARLLRPPPTETAPGSVGVISFDATAARTGPSAELLANRKLASGIKDLALVVIVAVTSNEHVFSLLEALGLDRRSHMVVYSNDEAEALHLLREAQPLSLSVNHIPIETIFSSYAPCPDSSPQSDGIRWPVSLFQMRASVLLPGDRPTSLGLSGAASSHRATQLIRKTLASRIAKTKRLAKATRPKVSLPLLRVFFLQGLFLFWGTALSGVLLGAGIGAFKLFRLALDRYSV